MKKIILLLIFLCSIYSFGQENIYKYYIYISGSNMNPLFGLINNSYKYLGNDLIQNNFFNDNKQIIKFEKAFPDSIWENTSSVMHLETYNPNLANELITTFPDIYLKYDDLTNDKIELLSYPNDYGTSSPNPNLGANIYRKDLDYINIQKAWDINTGTGFKIGISDSRINTTNQDFIDNVSFINQHVYQGLPFTAGMDEIIYNHGTGVSGIAAAKGNNAYGSTGVCYDCEIVGTSYGNYNNLILLAQAGVRVINMSWASCGNNAEGHAAQQNLINNIINMYGVVFVAAAGNRNSYQNSNNYFCDTGTMNGPNFQGLIYCYPASYNGVISVSSVNHINSITTPLIPNQLMSPSYCCTSPTGVVCFLNLENSVGDTCDGVDPNNPVGIIYNGFPRYCNIGESNQYISSQNGLNVFYTTNPKVDILAPTNQSFRYDIFAEQNIISYTGGGTSGAAPYVSGTAALMLNTNNCLNPYDIDSILKLTSNDVENLPINQNFVGQIGSGSLNAGNAVEFVNEMKKTNGNAIIENHIFNRFIFNLNKFNNKLTFRNVTLKDYCFSTFTAKNQIHIQPGTKFSPNVNGSIKLSINPNIDVNCTPFILPPSNKSNKNLNLKQKSNIILFPNPNEGVFDIINIDNDIFGHEDIKIQVFDLNGRQLYTQILNKNETANCKLQLENLITGVYLIKLTSTLNHEELKFIKQ